MKHAFNHLSLKPGTELTSFKPGNDLANTVLDIFVNTGFAFSAWRGGNPDLSIYRNDAGAIAILAYDAEKPRKSKVVTCASGQEPSEKNIADFIIESFAGQDISARVEEMIRAEENKHTAALKRAAEFKRNNPGF